MAWLCVDDGSSKWQNNKRTGGGNFRGPFLTGTPRSIVTPDPAIFRDVMGEGTPTNGAGATGGTSPLTALRRAAVQVHQLRASTPSTPTTIMDTPRMPQRPIYAAAGRGARGVTFTSSSKIWLPTVLHLMLCLSQYNIALFALFKCLCIYHWCTNITS